MLRRDQDTDADASTTSLSKRAALRLIQRAVVVAGRERTLRQHIREARVTTLWVLEDWELEWTALIDHGDIRFARRPARQPDVTFRWASADDFFETAQKSSGDDAGLQVEGDAQLRRLTEPVCRAFLGALGKVMRFPFDDAGVRLV